MTVRALQYYDKIGLLKPTSYSNAGRRQYSPQDFIILQQIVTLKFIGLSLDQIKDLLTTDEIRIDHMLEHQKGMLKEKVRQLEKVIAVIERAENAIDSSTNVNLEQVIDIIREVNMSNQTNWLDQFLTKDQQSELVSQAGTLAEQKQIGKAWKQVFEDIQMYLSSEPDEASEAALIDRWQALIKSYSQGDNHVQAGLESAYTQLSLQITFADLPEEVRTWLETIQDTAEFVKNSR